MLFEPLPVFLEYISCMISYVSSGLYCLWVSLHGNHDAFRPVNTVFKRCVCTGSDIKVRHVCTGCVFFFFSRHVTYKKWKAGPALLSRRVLSHSVVKYS